MDDDGILAQMKKLGPAQVRALIASGKWPDAAQPAALTWLQETDRESQRLAEASLAAQVDVAKYARDAAVSAAAAAHEIASEARLANSLARHASVRATTATIIAATSAAVAIFATLIAIIALLAPR
jgi:hypothetical protein